LPTEYDAGKAALDDLIQWVEANVQDGGFNEADTRLHVIDRLLIEVLRWPRSAIRTEQFSDGGRIDYALGSPGPKFIWEAKREGAYFDLPAGTVSGVHSIRSISDGDAGKALKDAMDQVAAYAANEGVAPAAVCNGTQLVVFLAVRTDNIKPSMGRALVFPSLQDLRSNFRQFWDNASSYGIDAKRLYTTLRVTAAPPPAPLSAHITNYPGVQRRNDLQAGLDILGDLFLNDVARLEEVRADFLRDCYASSGALSQYAMISKQILQSRYAMLNEEEGPETTAVATKKGVAPSLTQDMLAAAAASRPIVLLGDVGVGKTTFIQRLVYVEAPELFENAFTIYIDFGTSTTLGDLGTFVIEESARQLRARHGIDIEDIDFVEDVYREDLKLQERRILGRLKAVDPVAYERERLMFLQRLVDSRAEHLRNSLIRLRSTRRRQIVVFLDNIDQRSDDDQVQVFLISNELAQNWPATVFVTLRPETFYASSRRGALSGYQPRVFTISPPRADTMLQRRVDFALHQLKDSGRLGSFPVGVTVDSQSLIDFLEVLAENFRTNERLLELIDNIAGGNMRLALRFVVDFLGSGHVNTAKILQIYREDGRYIIAVHEFLRALLFGDYRYYDPDSSPIANILRITQPDGREHFLLPILLTQAQVFGEQSQQEGYVAADVLHSFCQQLGFTSDQVAGALEYAVEHRLLDSTPRYTFETHSLFFRITTVGAYTTKMLLAYFAYIDAVLVDTPIVDDQYARLIEDVHSLTERVTRGEFFRLYLDKQWAKVPQGLTAWNWAENSGKLAADITRVGRVADPEAWRHRY
jgi:GTPase SAR1 family protein